MAPSTPPAAAIAALPWRRWREALSGGILTFILMTLLMNPQPLQAHQVLVNPTVGHAPEDRQTLRAIFSMRLRTWPDGSPITVYVLPTTHPVHVEFCKETLGVFPHQLQRAWDRLVYSGTGQAPVEVSSLEEMRQRVRETPGAIGYLEEADKDDEGMSPDAR